MILMRQGRAKQRHDAVAHHLVDGAFVTVHGGHHPFQHGIEELAGVLRIALGQQFHGALEIGKQHRDLLALAFQGTAGGQDLLGKIVVACRREVAAGDTGAAATGGEAASPVQTSTVPVLIGGEPLALDEFSLEVLEGLVIQVELPLQHAIGHTAPPLQHGNRLVHDLFKVTTPSPSPVRPAMPSRAIIP